MTQLVPLEQLLTGAGYQVDTSGFQLRVHGSDRAAVSQIAQRHSIALLGLTEATRSLEDSLLDLTAGSAEFASS
jgi:ABC-2 type transport system ATP-binding protein